MTICYWNEEAIERAECKKLEITLTKEKLIVDEEWVIKMEDVIWVKE